MVKGTVCKTHTVWIMWGGMLGEIDVERVASSRPLNKEQKSDSLHGSCQVQAMLLNASDMQGTQLNGSLQTSGGGFHSYFLGARWRFKQRIA